MTATTHKGRGSSRIRSGLWYTLPALFVFVLMVVFLLDAFTITGRDAIYPQVVVVLMLVISAINVVADARKSSGFRLSTPEELEEGGEIEGEHGMGADLKRTSVAAALIIAFPLIGVPFGFFPGAVVLTLGMMLVLGVRDWRRLLFMTVIIVGAAYVAFTLGLGVRFPPGTAF